MKYEILINERRVTTIDADSLIHEQSAYKFTKDSNTIFVVEPSANDCIVIRKIKCCEKCGQEL